MKTICLGLITIKTFLLVTQSLSLYYTLAYVNPYTVLLLFFFWHSCCKDNCCKSNTSETVEHGHPFHSLLSLLCSVLCWNSNSSTTSNTLDFLWTPSAQQVHWLFV